MAEYLARGGGIKKRDIVYASGIKQSGEGFDAPPT